MEKSVLSLNTDFKLPLKLSTENQIHYQESESDAPLIIDNFKNKKRSFCNKLFFRWTKLAMKISNKKSLKVHHLTDHDKTEYIRPLYAKLFAKWYDQKSDGITNDKYISKNKPHLHKRNKGMCPLFLSILSSNLFDVLLVIMLSIILTVVKLLQINLQRKLILLFKNSENKTLFDHITSSIPFIAAIFLLNKIIQIFLTHHTMHYSQIVGTKAGNMLSALIYEKMMRTAIFLKNQISEGEIINYIQVDIDTLGFVFFYAPLTIVVPFQFFVYIYMLFTYFGASFIFGFLIFLVLFMIAWIIQKLYISNQRILLKNKDQRLKLTSNTLHILKILKLYAWEDEFIDRIGQAREDEMRSMKKIQNVYVLSGFIHYSIPLILAVASIGIFTLINGEMPIENLLTSIEIFDSMSYPLYRLPIFITSLLNCLISMKRLENFLNERDIEGNSKEDNELKEQRIDIKFSNCNFGIINYRNNANKVLLKDINIEINKGDLVAVLGETGSGKTCLANAILNYLEYIPSKETCINVINGTVSYAAQNHWIMNESIRNNILFYNEMNPERYKEILDICQLTPDLEILPGGEFTEVSSNGTNISGGQKARISLARAIYKEADIYLFDDPMSSVDSIISMEIFNKVLLKYLKGKTRILIRHDIQNLHLMDKIIYMDKGRVIWSGTYEEFTKNDLYKDLVAQTKKRTTLEEEEKMKKRKMTIEAITRKKSTTNIQEKIAKGKLIKDEEMKVGSILLSLYLKFIKLIGGYFFFFILIILSLAIHSTQVGCNMWLMYWSSVKSDNLYSFLIYTQIGLFSLFFIFLKDFLFSRSFLNMNKKLHDSMLLKIMYAPINLFHDIVPIGQCINALTNDLDKCKIILKIISQILNHSSALFGSIVVCARFNIYSLISAPIMIILGAFTTKYYINAGRDLNRLDGISRTPIITCFSETISGATTIRAFKTQFNFKERYFRLLNNYFIVSSYKFGTTNWYSMHLDFSSYLYSFFIVIFACVFKDNFTAQAIGLLLKYSLSFSDQMLNSFNELSNVEKSMVSFERCDTYTGIIQEKAAIMNKDTALKKWPENGSITFKNYFTRYRPETDIVLNDINIEIKSGEKIGIVGRSGSGKSTLSLAVYRIIEPDRGEIYIDGVDITTIGLKKLRNSMCIVPQDPTLIEGTLRDNIDPLNQYKDEEIIQVLEELDFFEFMKTNNHNNTINTTRGLMFKIKEFGNNLSLGEKQLICFARAILKKSKIIFLDEATASLDQKTEDTIQQAINKHFKSCTVLTIAHRVQTIKQCDRILVMDKGKIAECDSPSKLLQNPKGIFYSLYYKNLQAMSNS